MTGIKKLTGVAPTVAMAVAMATVISAPAQASGQQPIYQACLDKDFPQQVRVKLRSELKKRFQTG